MTIRKLKARYDGKQWPANERGEVNVSATFECEGLSDKASGEPRDAMIYAPAGSLQAASLLKVQRGQTYFILQKPAPKAKTGSSFKLLTAEVASVILIQKAIVEAAQLDEGKALAIAIAIYAKHA